MKKTLLSVAVLTALATQVSADEISDLKEQLDSLNKKVTKLKRNKKELRKKHLKQSN